VIVEKKLLCI